MKSLGALVLAVLAASLVGCGSEAPAPPPPADKKTVTPGFQGTKGGGANSSGPPPMSAD